MVKIIFRMGKDSTFVVPLICIIKIQERKRKQKSKENIHNNPKNTGHL
jgi:hypothetical protein